MIEKLIKKAILEHGAVSIPDLGTFRTARVSAELNTDIGQIAPPSAQVEFNDDIGYGQDLSLVDFIVEQYGCERQHAEDLIGQFNQYVKQTILQDGQVNVEGLGFFSKGTFGNVIFQPDEQIPVLAETYGLPKLKAQSLALTSMPPQSGSETQEEEPAKEQAMLWLALIPLILFAVVAVYVFLNPQAQAKLWSMFSSEGQELVEREKPREDQLDPVNQDYNEVKPATDQENTLPDITENPVKPAQKEQERTPAAPPNTTSSGATLVAEKTSRWYLSVASYPDLAQAQSDVKKAVAKGYNQAKVVQAAPDKFRVSIADFDTREAADAKASEAAGDYKGIWIFKF
jgi:nucleoid DNA-binding protein